MAPRYHFLLFGWVYLLQGVILAYLFNFQKPYLQNSGFSLEQIAAISSILVLPFVLKVAFGYLSDRYSFFGWGHRKPYIFIGLAVCALGFVIHSFLPPAQYGYYSIAFVFFAVMGMALFDTAVDGLAIELNRDDKLYGRIQSAMISGRALGIILGSVLFGASIDGFGYRGLQLQVAAILLVSLPLVRFFEETEGPQQRLDVSRSVLLESIQFLRKPEFLLVSAYLFLSLICSYGISGLITLYGKTSLSLPASAFGTLGGLKGAGQMVGALFVGYFIAKSRSYAMAIFAVLALAVMSALLGVASSQAELNALTAAWGVTRGMHHTLLSVVSMSLIPPGAGATLFALLMLLSNVAIMVTEGMSTALLTVLSYESVFAVLSAFSAASALVLWLSRRYLKPKVGG